MMHDARFEEILDECIDRLGAGEAPEDVLRSYPQHAVALRPLLQSAARANAPAPPPDVTARAQAMNGMLGAIESKKNAGRSRAIGVGGVGVWSSWFGKRPLAYRGLALLTGVALVGGVAAGASAAGTGPKPVREFFGFQSDSIRVEFDGVIVGTNAVDGELTVQTGSDVRTVIVTGTTELSDGGDSIAFGDLALGDPVEVKGTLQLDNTILASRVHREDGPGDDQGEDGTPSTTPTIGTATPDDDEDNVDDSSGPGSGNDDAEVDDADDDNSGPGSGADDELEDESPGSSIDDADELDDDSPDSSSGNADELEDDSSGSSSDDGTELDDSSGSGSTETPDDHSSDSGSDDD